MIKTSWMVLSLGVLSPLIASAADYSVTLSNVHLCCNSCVRDADDAVKPVAGTSAVANKDSHSIKITAASPAAAQKAVNALTDAGFYGKPSDAQIHVKVLSAPEAKVQSLELSGLHLCCGKCVSSFNQVVGKVSGVTGTNAAKDADTVVIKGNFSPEDLAKALNAAGFTAKID